MTSDSIVLLFLAAVSGFGAAIGMYVAIRIDLVKCGMRLTQAEKDIDILYGRPHRTEHHHQVTS